MTIVRLTKVNEVVHLWPFLSEGLSSTSRYLKYDLTLDTYRKILFSLVRQPYTSWVSVAFNDDRVPVGFFVAHECTPLFSLVREFEISLFYHIPGPSVAVTQLQKAFDYYCSANKIKRYYATTCRKSGSASRVFGEELVGLKRAYTVFKKNIT